jgi:phosphoglycerol transferase MdoB-like AlkP superfamily enzyme
MKWKFPFSIRYIWFVYLAGLAFFTIFRVVLYVQHAAETVGIPHRVNTILYAFFIGFRFDTVISGYLLALPLLLLLIAEFVGFLSKTFLFFIHCLLSICYAICFFGCAADIPFYNNYNTRLNATILNWTDSPAFMIKMVFEDKIFLLYFIAFVLVSICFVLLLRSIYRRFVVMLLDLKSAPKYYLTKTLFAILALGLLLLGIRGRTDEKTPIQVGTAFFSPYNLPNQLGLNPMFSFLRSYLDAQMEENKYFHIMDEGKALNLVQQYIHVPEPNPFINFPIARKVVNTPIKERYNVVVVIMESMSASYLKRYGNTENLTPVLDQLADNSLCFDNFYSAGIHTFNGIFSTLYAYPALLAKHSMYGDVIPQYTGLPYVLKENGYHNIFFTTHDDQFDNIAPFVTVNHFDEVIGQKDYPRSEVLSTLGIPDHKLFQHVLDKLDNVAANEQIFFAAIMTGSNHDPFNVPEDVSFKTKNYHDRNGCVAYADWSIGEFLKAAAKKPWYPYTIFVFLGDHGTVYNYDMYGDMSYPINHIPLFIFNPSQPVKQQYFNNPGGQIDVFPTISNLLGLSYINNTLGQDLLHEKRPFMFFGADDKIGVVDSTHFYVWHKDGEDKMYDLGKSFTNNIISNHRATADSMRDFALANTQAAQWLIANKKTGVVK